MKIFKFIFLTFSLVLLVSCGKRVPFSPQKPLQDASLVYIYNLAQLDSSENVGQNNKYKIRINNKRVDGDIKSGEYNAYNLKSGSITISATKNVVLESKINLELKISKIYYLKIIDNSDNFELIQVDDLIGSQEIKKTGLANSIAVEDDEKISKIIKPKKETKNISKIDEINKIYKMKSDGILTEDEFQTLKKEILSK